MKGHHRQFGRELHGLEQDLRNRAADRGEYCKLPELAR
jgi:hypothetical protein